MPKNSKRQICFFVDEKLEKLLESADSAERDRTINAALKMWFESQSPGEVCYDNTFLSFIDWLKIQNDPLMLATKSGKKISLTRVLQKFARQDQRRPAQLGWGKAVENDNEEEEAFAPNRVVESGVVTLSQKRCDVCHRVLDGDVINSPSRGRVCRTCSEFPGIRRPSTQQFRQQVAAAFRLLVAIDAAEEREKETLLDLFAKHSLEVQEAAISSFRSGRE